MREYDPGVRLRLAAPRRPTLLRLAVAPLAAEAQELAARIVADLADPRHGVLPAGAASVEARFGDRLPPLSAFGMELAGPAQAAVRTAVQRSAFTGSTIAAAHALRQLVCASALVCTPNENVAAAATYVSAGFTRLPDVPDLRRPAPGPR